MFKLTRWEKIYYPTYRAVVRFYDFFRYDIHQGVGNLIRWFPVIWRDRDYDEHYLFAVMKKKLRQMAKCQKIGPTMSGEETAKKMNICVNLLDRLMKSDYDVEALRKVEEKWGELIDISSPNPDNRGYYEFKMKYENVKTPKDEEESRKMSRRETKLGDARQQYDKDYLFDIIKKHIFGWWN